MVDQVGGAKLPSWVVPPEFAGRRLDAFARHCLPHLSRRVSGEALAEKLFLLDGRPGRKGDRLVAGNLLVFAGPVDWLAEQPPPAVFELPIVYEDDSILVVDKPAGVATHGFSARDVGTLANWLAARRPALLNVGKSRWEPGLLNRLDVETSGLVLIAKTQAAFDRLRAQFRRREIDKTYLALVWRDADAEGVIDLPLAHDAGDRRRMRVMRPGLKVKRQRVWPALTRYRKLGAARGGLSLLEIHMATGVTHQIRVHLAAIGHPIVGDALYGTDKTEKFALARHFLHAKGLVLCHPDDRRRLEIEAELPRELREVLRRLGIKY
ncbi:MAG: RluA family pseudouridine synthase [Deltaproteobacteria bacterium]|nr:RluA family pseudouridine synthase [Deltaproteobacteria bacterium]